MIRSFFYTSENKNLYINDDQSRLSMLAHPELKKTSEKSTDVDSYYVKKYAYLKAHGFFTKSKPTEFAVLEESIVEDNIKNIKQVVFEVTDSCNLSCTYCAFGELYDGYDERISKKIDIHKAIHLLKFIFDHKPKKKNDKLAISFYGGEPLLNMTFIEQIVELSKELNLAKQFDLEYTMTTNTTLLHKYMDFLVANNFRLLISLDGNEKCHSYRTFKKDNENSFQKVIENLDRLQKDYPDYFLKNISFNAVLHDRNTTMECPGLVHGKMGIAIFFFHYAQYTNNMLFADYAMDLIDQILNQLHVNSPANYKKGIAGIGVGFDYMIRNNFLDIEDDICEDFDGRMYRAVKYDPWQDFSQYNGLTGYGRYWMTRLNFPTPAMQARECLTSIVKLIEEHLPDISAEEQIDVYCFLYDLQEISGSDRYTGLLEQCRRIWGVQSPDLIQAIPRLKESVVGNIARVYLHHRYLHEPIHDNVDITLKQIPDLEMGKAPVATGLLNGYAGEGMIRLAALDRANISWVNLL